jgi:hypothetical protein
MKNACRRKMPAGGRIDIRGLAGKMFFHSSPAVSSMRRTRRLGIEPLRKDVAKSAHLGASDKFMMILLFGPRRPIPQAFHPSLPVAPDPLGRALPAKSKSGSAPVLMSKKARRVLWYPTQDKTGLDLLGKVDHVR